MGAPNPDNKADKPKESRIKVAKNSKKPKSTQKAKAQKTEASQTTSNTAEKRNYKKY